MTIGSNESEKVDDDDRSLSRLYRVFTIGMAIVLIGIAVLVAAVIVSGGQVSFGGVVIIGFIPIVIGAGPDAPLLILAAILLTIVTVSAFLVLRRKKNSD